MRQIADAMGFTVAAIYYHFRAKEDLLSAWTEPYLAELEGIVADAEASAPLDAARTRKMLDRYLDLLLAHGNVTRFLEKDLAVQALSHGARLDELTERFRDCLVGADPDPPALVRASAAVGALRRPVLRLGHLDLMVLRDQLLNQALTLLYPPSEERGS